MTSEDQPYRCEKCGTRFQKESRFIQHCCKQMKREQLLKEPVGQMALLLYQKWMQSHNRGTPGASAYLHSRYFDAFQRFAAFAKKTKLVDVDAFVSLMREKNIDPTIWPRDEVYAVYLEQLERRLTPERQASITINTLFNFAEDHNVDVCDVFTVLTPNDVIQFLRERKLSPWILLNSSKFKQFLINGTSGEHRVVLESIIRPPYWKRKFATNPEIVKRMKVYVSELRL